MDTNYRYFNGLGLIVGLFLLGGCASNLPQGIAEAPINAFKVQQAQANSQAYIGKTVRWGGEIVQVRNSKDVSDVEILARQLSSGGSPQSDSPADARFIARIQGFIDPAEYAEGSRITVSGILSGIETGKVGEYEYTYPLVSVESHHKWPKEKQSASYPPYYYDSYYYDPWWPYGGYGRWGRHPYWHYR